jgi:hypothetical protein
MSFNAKTKQVKRIFYLSRPLIPMFLCLFSFIATLSPMVWQITDHVATIIAVCIGLSLICAYCMASFFDEIKSKT